MANFVDLRRHRLKYADNFEPMKTRHVLFQEIVSPEVVVSYLDSFRLGSEVMFIESFTRRLARGCKLEL